MDAALTIGPALIRTAALVTDRYEVISSELGVDFRVGRLLVACTREPQTVGGLGRYVRVRKSTMTGILARMLADGLVERSPDPADRRASLITPTERGRHIAQELVRRVSAEVMALADPLSPQDQARLTELLAGIIHAADAVLPSE